MTIKRYSLSLEQELVTEFQAHVKAMKLGKHTMSVACNDMLKGMNQLFRQALETGKFTVTDLFTMMGQTMESSMEEQYAESTQKTAKVAKGNRRKTA